jgi:transposase
MEPCSDCVSVAAAAVCGRRAVIECCVGWLKGARRIATRYEKLAVHFLGVLKLGMIQKHLQLTLSNTP